MSTKFAVGLLGATALSVGWMPVANAAAFGPASGSIEVLGNPTVNTTSHTISFSDLPLFWDSSTGTLAGTTGVDGTINGTVTFSATATDTVDETVDALVTVGGFTFDVGSVYTESYVDSPGVSGSLGLYLLGTMGGNGDTATATSLTITANFTGLTPWSSSLTLTNPPAGIPPASPPPPSVPEPASLGLLGAALAGLGAVRRRRRA